MNTEAPILEQITPAPLPQTAHDLQVDSTPPPAPNPDCATPSKKRRPHRLWGAIQKLPTRTRQWLNQSLRDGVPYKQIIAALAKKNHHIRKQQLSNWVKSGYAHWLADQQLIETRKLHAEALAASHRRADNITRANLREVSALDLAIHLQDANRIVNMDDLRNLFAEKPENFFRLVRAHVAHERNALIRDRFEFEVKKHAAKEKKQKRATAPKKIPSRMDIERYKRDLKIVPAEYQPQEYGGKAPAARTSPFTAKSPAPSPATPSAAPHPFPPSGARPSLSPAPPISPAPLEPDYTDPYYADRIPFEI